MERKSGAHNESELLQKATLHVLLFSIALPVPLHSSCQPREIAPYRLDSQIISIIIPLASWPLFRKIIKYEKGKVEQIFETNA